MRSWIRAVSVVLVGFAAACDAPRTVLPELKSVTPQNDERAALQVKIAALEQLLRGNTFDKMAAGPYAHLAAGQRQSVVDALTRWRAELAALGGPVPMAHELEELVTEHWCMQNWSLNDCFSETSTVIETDGTGRVTQGSLVLGMHSSVTIITDNGVHREPIVKGYGLFSARLDESLSFRAPDCNAGDHKLFATTVHQLSAPVWDAAQLSGSKSSTDEAECIRGQLTVTLDKPSITLGDQSGVKITNMPLDCVPGVRSTNPGVATVQEYGVGIWLATAVSPGTTTITATCMANNSTGSATLTVTEPENKPDTYDKSGGSGGAEDCPSEYTYYHMRWSWSRMEYEWTGGTACLWGETRTIIFLPYY